MLLHNNLPGLESLGGKVDAEALTGQCPECQVDLVRVDGGDRQHPLHYDTCESCGGIFLESEFKDATDAKVALAGDRRLLPPLQREEEVGRRLTARRGRPRFAASPLRARPDGPGTPPLRPPLSARPG